MQLDEAVDAGTRETYGGRFARFMNGLAVVLGVAVVALLAVTSLVTSYRVGNTRGEFARNVPTLALASGACAVVVVALLAFVSRRRAKARRAPAGRRPRSTRWYDGVLFLVVTVLGLVWVALMYAPARGDSGTIMGLAGDLASGQRLRNLAYLQRCPHQIGYTLYAAAFYRVLGAKLAVAGIRVVNCLMCGGIAVLVRRFCSRIFPGAPASRACGALLVLFLPLPVYAGFAYGTIPSLFLALLGIYLLLYDAPSAGEKDSSPSVAVAPRVARLALGFASMFLSLAVKLNSLIFVLGLVAVCVVRAFAARGARGKASRILPALVCLVAYALAAKVPTALLESQRHVMIGEGTPKVAWVAMGMHDSPRGPGWYDGYVRDLYLQKSDSQRAMTAAARDDLQKSARALWSDPAHALGFYAGKVASQWAEPTFEAFWTTLDFGGGNLGSRPGESPSQRHERALASVREGQARHPVVAGMYRGAPADAAYLLLDVYQSVVYLAAAVGIWALWGDRDTRKLAFLVIFLGGFLFHLAWEAKSQYTFVYFLLLLPYASRGLGIIAGARGAQDAQTDARLASEKGA